MLLVNNGSKKMSNSSADGEVAVGAGHCRMGICAVLLASALFGAAAQAAGYRLIVESGVLPENGSEALSINEKGGVAGVSKAQFACGGEPLYWNGATGERRHVVIGNMLGTAASINSANMIAGASWGNTYCSRGSQRALLWTQLDTPPVELGTLSNDPSHGSWANGINEQGTVAMASELVLNGNKVIHAAIWKDGVLTDIDPGGAPKDSLTRSDNRYESEALAINNFGTVVGRRIKNTGKASKRWEAIIWKNGKQMVLPSLYETANTTKEEAVAINDDDVAVGVTTSIMDFEHALKWENGAVFDLGYGSARAINNAGVIVGRVLTAYANHAVIWRDGKTAEDINDLLDEDDRNMWLLETAEDINDRGQIIGRARRLPLDDGYHIYRLEPH